MQRYFFQINDERGTDEDPGGTALSSPGAAMLHALTICGEIGCNDGFKRGFAVCVRSECGAEIGRVSVVVATATLELRDV